MDFDAKEYLDGKLSELMEEYAARPDPDTVSPEEVLELGENTRPSPAAIGRAEDGSKKKPYIIGDLLRAIYKDANRPNIIPVPDGLEAVLEELESRDEPGFFDDAIDRFRGLYRSTRLTPGQVDAAFADIDDSVEDVIHEQFGLLFEAMLKNEVEKIGEFGRNPKADRDTAAYPDTPEGDEKWSAYEANYDKYSEKYKQAQKWALALCKEDEIDFPNIADDLLIKGLEPGGTDPTAEKRALDTIRKEAQLSIIDYSDADIQSRLKNAESPQTNISADKWKGFIDKYKGLLEESNKAWEEKRKAYNDKLGPAMEDAVLGRVPHDIAKAIKKEYPVLAKLSDKIVSAALLGDKDAEAKSKVLLDDPKALEKVRKKYKIEVTGSLSAGDAKELQDFLDLIKPATNALVRTFWRAAYFALQDFPQFVGERGTKYVAERDATDRMWATAKDLFGENPEYFDDPDDPTKKLKSPHETWHVKDYKRRVNGDKKIFQGKQSRACQPFERALLDRLNKAHREAIADADELRKKVDELRKEAEEKLHEYEDQRKKLDNKKDGVSQSNVDAAKKEYETAKKAMEDRDAELSNPLSTRFFEGDYARTEAGVLARRKALQDFMNKTIVDKYKNDKKDKDAKIGEGLAALMAYLELNNKGYKDDFKEAYIDFVSTFAAEYKNSTRIGGKEWPEGGLNLLEEMEKKEEIEKAIMEEEEVKAKHRKKDAPAAAVAAEAAAEKTK
ncbi:MAG: hypothetical protein LBT92_02410 [Rickettsiales bacterium]|jgi:hypothetical protein|nr:hypothetical protein [Rickettsiales bacterium]